MPDDFIQISSNGVRAGPVPPRPPPPPMPNQRPNGPPHPMPRPNVVNVQPGPVMHPPPPPQALVPLQLRTRPLVETSDIRRERFTEEDAREALSLYVMYRFTRAGDDGRSDEFRKAEPWETVTRVEIRDLSQKDIRKIVRDLDNGKKKESVGVKKQRYSPNQQRQMEKTGEELVAQERDPLLYQWELVQIDETTRPWDPRKDRDTARSNKKDARSKSRKRSRSNDSPLYSAWTSRKSRSTERKKKMPKVRVSITAIYKRTLRPTVQALNLLKQLEIDQQQRMRPPQPMNILPQQHQQQQHQHQQQQQQHQQQMHHMPQRPHVPPAPRAPIVVVGGDNHKREGKKYEGKNEKKDHRDNHHSPGRRRSPQRRASPRSSNSSESWAELSMSGSDDDTSGTHYSSSVRSDRGRRRDRRYLEDRDPRNFGIPLDGRPRRHSKLDDHRILDDLPRVPVPPIRMIAPAALTPEDLDRIEKNAYLAGKADAASEHASVDLAVGHMARRATLPPRVIQQQRPGVGVRYVGARDLEDEQQLDRFQLLAIKDRRERLEDEEWRLREVERYHERRASELEMREEELRRREEESLYEEELIERERLERERLRAPRIYARPLPARRASSPPLVRFENPFGEPRRRPTAY